MPKRTPHPDPDVRETRDAAAGLELVDGLTSEPPLENYHLLPSVLGDLLAKLGRTEEARVEFERAAALTRNARERELLLVRAAEAAASAS